MSVEIRDLLNVDHCRTGRIDLASTDIGVSRKANGSLDYAANGVDRFETNQFIVCTTLKRGIDGTW